jgi:hypothetical protein
MRVLFLERATRSGHTGYVAILHTVAIAPSDGQAVSNQGEKAHCAKSRLSQATCLCSRVTGN